LENNNANGINNTPTIKVITDLSYDFQLRVQTNAISIQTIPADNVKSSPFFDFMDKFTRNFSKDSFAIFLLFKVCI
jgi:hypothetical protein